MSNYVLGCGSTVDLNEQHLKERNVDVLPFHFRLGEKDYDDDFGKSIAYKDLYAEMAKGTPAKTSQTTAAEYEEKFAPVLEKGLDVARALSPKKRSRKNSPAEKFTSSIHFARPRDTEC